MCKAEKILNVILSNLEIKETIATGCLSLPYLQYKIEVEILSDEEENASMDELAAALEKFFEHFKNADKLDSMLQRVAEDITKEAYSQSETITAQGDIANLKETLMIIKIAVFPGCYVLHFNTPTESFDFDVCIQITDDFEFEDYV